MRKILILLILLLVGCSKNTYTNINQEEALKIMNNEKNYIIIDVRTQEEYKKKHIDNAINIPLNEIENSAILKDKEQIIFVYCQSGKRSEEASEKLANLGYTRIYNIGSINKWQK